MSILDEKKLNFINKIGLIAKASFNSDQKELAKSIINSSDIKNIDAIYQLISQRIKTGFVFDAAPEINHDCVSLIEENEDLYIQSKGNPVNFVEHKLIIGENYDALKNILATYTNPKNGKGLIDIIYIDPPYNTEKSKEDGNDYKTEVEASKFVYRDKFTRDGWLNLMNERLQLARKVMTDEGVIFISIDDVEHAYLKVLCDDIFDENNFIGSIAVIKAEGGGMAKQIIRGHDFLYVYAKNKNKFKPLAREKDVRGEIVDIGGVKYWIQEDAVRKEFGKYGHLYYEDILKYRNQEFKDKIDEGIKNFEYRLIKKDGSKHIIGKLRRLDEDSTKFYSVLKHLNKDGVNCLKSLGLDKQFPYPKPVSLIKELVKGASFFGKKEQIVLDFFAGSGTTGQAIMELNNEDGGRRKCILVTNNENNIAHNATWERLYRVIHGKGSNKESIEWKYSDSQHSLTDNKVRVFDINTYNLELNDIEKAKELVPLVESQFKLLNENYNARDKFDIYNELASLNPVKEE